MPGSLFEGIVKIAEELSGTSLAEPMSDPACFGAVVVVVGVVVVVVVGGTVSGFVVVVVAMVTGVVVVVAVVVVVVGGVRTRAAVGLGASPIN
jgi:hypothetical protein